MARSLYICLFFLFISSTSKLITSYPLSTKSRWIVDEKGQRVKLACVNWPAHLQPTVAEGLSKQPLDSISKKIVSMGFNCVRLTWPLDLMTNDTLALKVTVKQSFESLKLFEDVLGIQTHNPKILNLPLLNAFQEVVSNLGQNGVMVILDNHLTTPGWCCGENDLDAFFGYPNFDPKVWANGLSKMATLFKSATNVVGVSLRNEPRGARDYPDLWFRHMPEGAEAVHAANPKLLVILSGIDFDTNLSFLRDRFFNVSFTDKLVFELHWYSFSDGRDSWRKHNSNDFCAKIITKVTRNGGFLVGRGFPLMLTEFGTEESGRDISGNRYMNCLVAWAAQNDLDWAVWALTGDYYLRTGPGLQSKNAIFHPLSGLCVTHNPSDKLPTLRLGPCPKADTSTFNPNEGILWINKMCVEAPNVAGQKVKLGVGTKCSKLGQIAATKMHLAFKTSNGLLLCLDVDERDNSVVANPCKCLTKDASCDPASQWFKVL
ncbi:PREDICTED: uncharacterized protein LOC104720858 isoform X2 [Camelina sativa]|uniref:Uncharacterized protein LOC104720845 isoform X2 n=1 Tax=Camelina sativa TaxID=90675 RepID=A0ABM0U7C6_CAMSA|nr:PREDICTED: uncharacterized protein LOC104720845 isoform X2 [Camelina sativa]XP_010437061.1 PREDICTED: uncharacterized protein LOC104720858 isoform X2 [Camelina sativa]